MVRTPCCSKEEELNRGAWTAQEDMILSSYIKTHGEHGWRSLPKKAGLNRCGKSCRLRWLNYLRPDIKRGNISHDEEELIIRMHRLLGNRWALIAGRLPGRTDNEIKNYWNTHLSKKLTMSAAHSKLLHMPMPKITSDFDIKEQRCSPDSIENHAAPSITSVKPGEIRSDKQARSAVSAGMPSVAGEEAVDAAKSRSQLLEDPLKGDLTHDLLKNDCNFEASVLPARSQIEPANGSGSTASTVLTLVPEAEPILADAHSEFNVSYDEFDCEPLCLPSVEDLFVHSLLQPTAFDIEEDMSPAQNTRPNDYVLNNSLQQPQKSSEMEYDPLAQIFEEEYRNIFLDV